MNERVTLPAQSRAATRERLLKAATALLAEHGLHGVTSHEIAHAAGVAAGTFYVHFRDKREASQEVVARGLEQLQRRLEPAWVTAGPDPDLEEHLRVHTEGLLEFAETNRDLVRVLFDPACGLSKQTVRALELLVDARGRGGLEGVDARAAATDPDRAVAAEALYGMLTRVVIWWAEEPGRVLREAVVRTLTRLQLLAHAPGLAGPARRSARAGPS
jgi:AcrR family transcriptional regulator